MVIQQKSYGIDLGDQSLFDSRELQESNKNSNEIQNEEQKVNSNLTDKNEENGNSQDQNSLNNGNQQQQEEENLGMSMTTIIFIVVAIIISPIFLLVAAFFFERKLRARRDTRVKAKRQTDQNDSSYDERKFRPQTHDKGQTEINESSLSSRPLSTVAYLQERNRKLMNRDCKIVRPYTPSTFGIFASSYPKESFRIKLHPVQEESASQESNSPNHRSRSISEWDDQATKSPQLEVIQEDVSDELETPVSEVTSRQRGSDKYGQGYEMSPCPFDISPVTTNQKMFSASKSQETFQPLQISRKSFKFLQNGKSDMDVIRHLQLEPNDAWVVSPSLEVDLTGQEHQSKVDNTIKNQSLFALDKLQYEQEMLHNHAVNKVQLTKNNQSNNNQKLKIPINQMMTIASSNLQPESPFVCIDNDLNPCPSVCEANQSDENELRSENQRQSSNNKTPVNRQVKTMPPSEDNQYTMKHFLQKDLDINIVDQSNNSSSVDSFYMCQDNVHHQRNVIAVQTATRTDTSNNQHLIEVISDVPSPQLSEYSESADQLLQQRIQNEQLENLQLNKNDTLSELDDPSQQQIEENKYTQSSQCLSSPQYV